jgi:hypothetical protein
MSNTNKIKLSTSKGNLFTIVDDRDLKKVQDEGTWFYHKTGYAYRKITDFKGRRITVYLHRFIVGLKYGDVWQVDHIDGNRLNNSRSNLRIVTASENSQNKRSVGGSSDYRGVSKNGNKWVAAVNIPEGERIRKTFDKEIDAAIWAHLLREEKVPYYVPDEKILAAVSDNQKLKNCLEKYLQK